MHILQAKYNKTVYVAACVHLAKSLIVLLWLLQTDVTQSSNLENDNPSLELNERSNLENGDSPLELKERSNLDNPSRELGLYYGPEFLMFYFGFYCVVHISPSSGLCNISLY
jgi:hypothetical protein